MENKNISTALLPRDKLIQMMAGIIDGKKRKYQAELSKQQAKNNTIQVQNSISQKPQNNASQVQDNTKQIQNDINQVQNENIPIISITRSIPMISVSGTKNQNIPIISAVRTKTIKKITTENSKQQCKVLYTDIKVETPLVSKYQNVDQNKNILAVSTAKEKQSYAIAKTKYQELPSVITKTKYQDLLSKSNTTDMIKISTIRNHYQNRVFIQNKNTSPALEDQTSRVDKVIERMKLLQLKSNVPSSEISAGTQTEGFCHR